MKLALASFLAVLALPAVGWAQAVDTFDRVAAQLKEGQGIDVIDVQGRRTTGDVVRVSPSSLTIRTLRVGAGGRVFTSQETFAPVSVRKINKRDGVWNGALIGFVVGAGVGGMLAANYCETFCFPGAMVGFSGAAGAAVGTVADTLHKHALYSRRQTTSVAAITPVIAIERHGVQIAWRW